MKANVDIRMKDAHPCLVTDVSLIIKNDSTINKIATSPTVSFLLESVSTKQQVHSSNWIAHVDITRVFDNYVLSKFCEVTSDNTSANNNAWQQLCKAFPSLYFMGCWSHGLHHFVEDVFSALKTRKATTMRRHILWDPLFVDMFIVVSAWKDPIKFSTIIMHWGCVCRCT